VDLLHAAPPSGAVAGPAGFRTAEANGRAIRAQPVEMVFTRLRHPGFRHPRQTDDEARDQFFTHAVDSMPRGRRQPGRHGLERTWRPARCFTRNSSVQP
jgi:hypothetical protein